MGRLQQGDILGPLQAFELTALGSDQVPRGTVRQYNHAVILSQDCDLEQDYHARQGGQTKTDKQLFGALLCGAYEEDEVKGGTHRPEAMHFSRNEWKSVRQNMSPRYQHLGYVPGPDCSLVVDFKDYFFLPVSYLYEEIKQTKINRRASMESPWRDHLLQRFGFYITRIALSINFQDLPAPSITNSP